VIWPCELLGGDAENSYLAGDAAEGGALDQLLGHSITYRIVVGAQGVHAANATELQ
jgi:hypothetical protein